MYIYNMSKTKFILSLCCVVFFFGNLQMTAQDLSAKNGVTLIQPDYLKAGDTVAILAPSGILRNRNTEEEQAKRLLESWNLNVVVGQHVFSQDNQFRFL